MVPERLALQVYVQLQDAVRVRERVRVGLTLRDADVEHVRLGERGAVTVVGVGERVPGLAVRLRVRDTEAERLKVAVSRALRVGVGESEGLGVRDGRVALRDGLAVEHERVPTDSVTEGDGRVTVERVPDAVPVGASLGLVVRDAEGVQDVGVALDVGDDDAEKVVTVAVQLWVGDRERVWVKVGERERLVVRVHESEREGLQVWVREEDGWLGVSRGEQLGVCENVSGVTVTLVRDREPVLDQEGVVEHVAVVDRDGVTGSVRLGLWLMLMDTVLPDRLPLQVPVGVGGEAEKVRVSDTVRLQVRAADRVGEREQEVVELPLGDGERARDSVTLVVAVAVGVWEAVHAAVPDAVHEVGVGDNVGGLGVPDRERGLAVAVKDQDLLALMVKVGVGPAVGVLLRLPVLEREAEGLAEWAKEALSDGVGESVWEALPDAVGLLAADGVRVPLWVTEAVGLRDQDRLTTSVRLAVRDAVAVGRVVGVRDSDQEGDGGVAERVERVPVRVAVPESVTSSV